MCPARQVAGGHRPPEWGVASPGTPGRGTVHPLMVIPVQTPAVGPAATARQVAGRAKRERTRGEAATLVTTVVVVLVSALAGCSSVPSAGFSVSHNLLLYGSTRFTVSGTVDYVLPFYNDRGGGVDSGLARITQADYQQREVSFAAMRRDGLNLVRIPVGLTDYSRDTYGLGGPKGYLSRLEQTVRAADRAGLKVVISWWDSLGWGSDLLNRYRQLWSMMDAVVKEVGHDPNVMFEPYNEPNGIDWTAWTEVMKATLTEWRQVFHYKGVLILDTINYSWDLARSPLAAVQSADRALQGGAAQVVFANHRYPDGETCPCGVALQGFQDSLERWASSFPIIGTEYGVYSAGYAPNDEWMSALLGKVPAMERAGLNGAILFVWNWVDPNSLSHGPGGRLTAYGRLALHQLWRAG